MRSWTGIKWLYAALCVASLLAVRRCQAQVDPEYRSLLEVGYDQPLEGQGPQSGYAYFYCNKPDLIGTNIALRLALAPVYLNSELGFKQLISPYTDFGVGIEGGGYGDNYYEVRQGKFIKDESFNGHGGGSFLSFYQLLNPGMRIPLNFVARGGFHFATFHRQSQTATTFVLPEDQYDFYTRAGFRLAGKEPVLIPDLGMELSLWYQRDWRLTADSYGFDNDRTLNPGVNLYWVYGGINYTFKKLGHINFAVTAGDSSDSDRLSAWRLGGVLPLVSEFPLILPGYYYEELTAKSFVHLYAAYDIPLDPGQIFKFRLEAGSANIDYLPGFEQKTHWQTGAGCGLTMAPPHRNFQIVLRYGYGFNAIRDGKQGSHSVGVLFQYDFGKLRKHDE